MSRRVFSLLCLLVLVCTVAARPWRDAGQPTRRASVEATGRAPAAALSLRDKLARESAPTLWADAPVHLVFGTVSTPLPSSIAVTVRPWTPHGRSRLPARAPPRMFAALPAGPPVLAEDAWSRPSI